MILTPVFKKFWQNVEKDDMKRMSKHVDPEGITEIDDVSYIDDGKWQHKLDVYYPTERANEKLPVIIDIHGGGWMYGNKELNKFYNLHLAKRGYTVFNINYSLVPEVTVPEQLREIASALEFINKNLGNYPCDKSKVLLTGDSAGGQLALYTAVLLKSSVLRNVFSVKDSGLKITCLALTSPVPDMDDGFPMSAYTKVMWGKNYASSPTSHYMNFKDISKFADLPPTYLVTSSGDAVGRKPTVATYNRIKALGVRTEIKNWEKFNGKNLPHVFSVLEPENEESVTAINDMLDFFKTTY